jgi:NAD(P)-dependent dehydrogenase (short-subunit alcohol dehydrogenase family)
MRLLGKKAIVTGANRSIGRSIATAFAQEGADVVISYRSDEKGAKEVIQSIEKMGRKGLALHADFSKGANVERFFKQAVEFLGSLDILVNNAGGYNTAGFLELSVDEFEQLLKVSVTAPMQLTQLAAKHMIEKGISGNIINISSISGERPYPKRVAHATGKAALNMLTKSMALELAPYNIRVNAIAPGVTPYEDDSESLSQASTIPLRRVGKPEDHAFAALYLASDESSWLTGQILTIDGGQALSFAVT